MQKNEVGPLPNTVYKKLIQKWIKELNVRKFRRKHRGEKLHYIGLGDNFLDIHQRHR